MSSGTTEKKLSSQAPLVSIFVPVYNTGRYVIQALESVIQQRYPNIECIIIDDKSTDNSVKIVKTWIRENDFKCQFIQHSRNIGIARSLNQFISISSGKYFTIIGDDLWNQNKLLKQVEMLEEAGAKCALVYSDMELIDENNNMIANSHFEKKGWKDPTNMPSGNVGLIKYLKKSFIPAPSVMLRMSCVKAVGGYDENLYTEDVGMWAKLLQRYEIRYSPQKFVKYRIRKDSMSNNYQSRIRIYQTHLKIWPQYLKNFEEQDKEVLLKKIFSNIKRYYAHSGDKELCLKVINEVQQHSKRLVWGKLAFYIRLGVLKSKVGYFNKW